MGQVDSTDVQSPALLDGVHRGFERAQVPRVVVEVRCLSVVVQVAPFEKANVG
jgi:hypothetical protein